MIIFRRNEAKRLIIYRNDLNIVGGFPLVGIQAKVGGSACFVSANDLTPGDPFYSFGLRYVHEEDGPEPMDGEFAMQPGIGEATLRIYDEASYTATPTGAAIYEERVTIYD